MKNIDEKKATFFILIVVAIILALVIVPLIILDSNNNESFPGHSKVDISESNLNDDTKYNSIREQLENDYYFSKLAIIGEYNSKNYSSIYLQDMVWNFIFNYELLNNNYFISSDKTNGIYCMKKETLIKAFKELYDVDISSDLKYLPGYYEYVYIKNNNYCLNFKNVSMDYDNEIKVAIERMTMIGTTVTTDVYVYEYYNNDSDNKNVNVLDNYIKNKKYNDASNIVIHTLNGKVTHKQLQLKVLNNGKFFKFKILLSKELDY